MINKFVYFVKYIIKMINIHKQIDYWINGALDDLESAQILIDRKRMLHGLFFCQLVIEKTLKAHVVKVSATHIKLDKLKKIDFSLRSK